MAVLPMSGSPSLMRTGLFLVRRERMRTTRRISSSPDDRIKLPGLLHEVVAVHFEHLTPGEEPSSVWLGRSGLDADLAQ
jgi:hypothetical protein